MSARTGAPNRQVDGPGGLAALGGRPGLGGLSVSGVALRHGGPARVLGTIGYAPGLDLLRAAGGEPLLLDARAADLVQFANADFAVDTSRRPEGYTVAEMMLSWFHRRFHDERTGNGERLKDVESHLRRYLLPYAMELALVQPEVATVANFSVLHGEQLASALAGDGRLPAATVAGDLLRRRVALRCVWLNVSDAAQVCAGGRVALEAAFAAGVIVARYTSTGVRVVAAAHLRSAGLLLELDGAHGRQQSTAHNILRTLAEVMRRAQMLGVAVPGAFAQVPAVVPVNQRREREPREHRFDVGIAEVAGLCAYVPPAHQVAVWIARLTGLRLGEVFGLDVADYRREKNGGIGWLKVETQGGCVATERSPETGRFERTSRKEHLKTRESQREIPIGRSLADLIDLQIAVFNTDLETGRVDPGARLVPGLRSPNEGGAGALYRRLKAAGCRVGLHEDAADVLMHDMRRTVITELRNAGVADRLANAYVGHLPDGRSVHDAYDGGPPPQALVEVADSMERILQDGLSTVLPSSGARVRLMVPTAARSQWGRATRRGEQREVLQATLATLGWQVQRGAGPSVDTPTGSADFERAIVDTAMTLEHDAGAELGGAGEDLLDAVEVSVALGVAATTVRRWMREGVLTAHQTMWGARQVWVAYRADVEACRTRMQAAATLPTLKHLAEETGLTYHRVWTVARDLGLLEGSADAAGKLHLSAEASRRLAAALAQRREAAETLLTRSQAASFLELAPGLVDTLVRRGELEVVADPSGARRTFLTRTSVEAYGAKYPPRLQPADTVSAGAATDVECIALVDIRRVLCLTHAQMTKLVELRNAVIVLRDRRRYLTFDSAVALAADEESVRALEALRQPKS